MKDHRETTTEVLSSVAVCDPRVITGAIFADEAAYLAKQVPLRMSWDATMLPILTHAAFLFDTIIAEPVMLMGLKPILGHNFLEIFGRTIERVQQCGFISFNPMDHVPEEKRGHLKKLQQFLAELQVTERRVKAMAKDENVSLSAPVESALLYSRFTGLPYIGSDQFIQTSGNKTQQDDQDKSRYFTVLAEILSVELPNLHVSSLDDVLSIRSTPGASQFRKVMMELVPALSTELLDEPGDLRRIVERWNQTKNDAVDVLVREFRSDIDGWSTVKAGFSVLLDIAGFIPGVSLATGVIGASKDAAELVGGLAKKEKLKELAFISFLSELRSRSL